MNDNGSLTKGAFAYMVMRVVDNAKDALIDKNNNKDDLYYIGKLEAYYEVLDTIKNELEIRE